MNTIAIPATKVKHYVNNEHFLQEMIVFRAEVKEAEATNGERPRVPEYIGECLFKIATHLARKPNFANYTFREDMVSDGIENCLLRILAKNAKREKAFVHQVQEHGQRYHKLTH